MSTEKKVPLPSYPASPVRPLVLQPMSGQNIKSSYRAKAARGIGIFQIVGGILMMLFSVGIVFPALRMDRDVLIMSPMHGFWAMIWLIIAGGLGIGAAKRKTKCLIIAHMVLSIFAAIAVFCVLGYSIAAIVVNSVELHDRMGYDYYYDDVIEPDMNWDNDRKHPDGRRHRSHHDRPENKLPFSGDMDWLEPSPIPAEMDEFSGSGSASGSGSGDLMIDTLEDYDYGYFDRFSTRCFGGYSNQSRTKLSLAMSVLVMILSFLLFVMTIWGSALACKVTCCGTRDSPVSPGRMYVHPTNPQVVMIGDQSFSVVSGNPTPVVQPQTKEQEALGITPMDARMLNPQSPPPPY